MSYSTLNDMAPGHAAAATFEKPRLVSRILRSMRAAFHRAMERRRHRLTAQALRHLSDHTLRDIGISRSDIPAIARGDYDLRYRL